MDEFGHVDGAERRGDHDLRDVDRRVRLGDLVQIGALSHVHRVRSCDVVVRSDSTLRHHHRRVRFRDLVRRSDRLSHLHRRVHIGLHSLWIGLPRIGLEQLSELASASVSVLHLRRRFLALGQRELYAGAFADFAVAELAAVAAKQRQQ